MKHPVNREIERFEAFAAQPPRGLVVERLCEFGILVRGSGDVPQSGGKDIGLVLMGLTHGNEWAGAAVLNEVLAHLAAGHVARRPSIAFILGNPWAARENKRFLERDLNRSFARKGGASREDLRAAELTPVLQRAAYLVDFHQTTRASDRAFFIFPHSPSSFAFARRIAPRLTVVTHWGKPFSTEGMCSDEFVNSQGGVGVSLEVGQNGLDPYQIAVGTQAGLWAIEAVTDLLDGRAAHAGAAPASDAHEIEAEIFTWAEIVPWPATGIVELAPGWSNFADVAAGQSLGTVSGQPLMARAAGKMLFPKYLTPEQQQALESRPTELCRIMRRIRASELPS